MNIPELLSPVHTAYGPSRWTLPVFALLLAGGMVYASRQLYLDVATIRPPLEPPYLLLVVALFVALGFEFINGFHDTANAVATVIYTHSLPPYLAVVWSGLWNFIGVLISSGAVAFSLVELLPVELILQVGSDVGLAMVFALLLAASIWNLGTWYVALPISSSHTLIGSIIGVGLVNELVQGGSATSGMDWSQTTQVGYALLLSPVIGFSFGAVCLLVTKVLIKNPALFQAPQGRCPPPLWIRALLILTCTGVSFAHGSNDGQKGMGLIMLILIGTVPMAYALNHAVPPAGVGRFITVSEQASEILGQHGPGIGLTGAVNSREEVIRYIQTGRTDPVTIPALGTLVDEIAKEVSHYPSYAEVPDHRKVNIRNDMYLVEEALGRIDKLGNPNFTVEERRILKQYRDELDRATKFIPTWVKIAVAIALGLGTMVAWKRIVITVGERIGKRSLSYAQGASAELVAMSTIGAADLFGMPVSTTHVLSSAIAGTMAANGCGLQWTTIRKILVAWVLTLPMSIALSGGLFWLLRYVVS